MEELNDFKNVREARARARAHLSLRCRSVSLSINYHAYEPKKEKKNARLIQADYVCDVLALTQENI